MSAALSIQYQPGVEPWRNAGTTLPKNASPAEILEATNFFEVEERDIHVAESGVKVADRKALIRSDTGQYLSTVGRDYEVVQYSTAFKAVIDAAAEQRITFQAFGSFAGGKRAWVLGEYMNPLIIQRDDSPLRKFVLAVAGHDGSTAVLLKSTGLRIWCSNSISAAMRTSGGLWRVHHTRSAPKRLEEVARGLRVVEESFTRLGELANQLAVTAFSAAQMASLTKKLLPIADDNLDHSRTHQGREKLMALFENGVGVTNKMRGSCWAAVNSTSEYFDHHRVVRGASGHDGAARRLESQWLGTAAAKKEEALLAITEAVGLHLAA